MASNFFKRRYLPNADGSDSTTALTDANTAFVHTYQGDDNTGDGTRVKPYKSIYKANQKSGISYIVFRGVVNEYFNASKSIIGDDINQNLFFENYSPQVITIYNLSADYITLNGNTNTKYLSCIFSNKGITNDYPWFGDTKKEYCLFPLYYQMHYTGTVANQNNTYVKYINSTDIADTQSSSIITKNSIITNYFDPYYQNTAFFGNYKYFIFLASCVFYYNGVKLIQPKWTNDSQNNIDLLRNSFINAGMPSQNAALLFFKDSFGNETCRIINEERTGGTSKNIFNRYSDTLTGTLSAAITVNTTKTSITLIVTDSSLFSSTGDIFIPNADNSGYEVFTYTSVTINSSTSITFTGISYTFKVAHDLNCTCTKYGDVVDFNLNPDIYNEALFASDTGSYVGCFKAATPINSSSMYTLDSVINVNSDGSDDSTTGTLLLKNTDDSLSFQSGGTQTWNRVYLSNTITIPVTKKFNGLGCMSQDGSPFGYYFGKYQNLIDSTEILPTDTLLPNTWYKVCNSISMVYNAIVYNNIQYLPDYFFNTGSGPTTFSRLNSDNGTVLKKVLASPMESIEIIPYDTETMVSNTLPKFSAPLFGDCKMLFWKSGNTYSKTSDTPVLFSDTPVLAITDKINYYTTGTTMNSGWAVTNADQEFFTLSQDTTNYYYDYPIMKYFRICINGHFSKDYDQ